MVPVPTISGAIEFAKEEDEYHIILVVLVVVGSNSSYVLLLDFTRSLVHSFMINQPAIIRLRCLVMFFFDLI